MTVCDVSTPGTFWEHFLIECFRLILTTVGCHMGRRTEAADRAVKDTRRQTRKRYQSGKQIRIVLAGLQGEDSVAGLCRQEGIAQGMYYS